MNVTLPPRIVRDKPKRPLRLRCPAHLSFVRSHACCAANPQSPCEGPIQAAHVRSGTDGYLSGKPGDNWTISLCDKHHRRQHFIGEPAFEKAFGIDMKALAAAFWAAFRKINPAAVRRAELRLGRTPEQEAELQAEYRRGQVVAREER